MEKTEKIPCICQFGGIESSARENVDPDDIAALLDYFEKLELDPKRFVLGVEEEKMPLRFGQSVFLWNNADYRYDLEGYENGELVRPLVIAATGDNVLYILRPKLLLLVTQSRTIFRY